MATQLMRDLSNSMPACFQFYISQSCACFAQRDTILNLCVVSLATRGRLDVWRLKPGLDVHPTLTENGVSMTINSFLYLEYSSEMRIDLRQSVWSPLWEVDGGDSFSVLMVSTTLGIDWSSWDYFCSVLTINIIYILSFSCPSFLCFSKRCFRSRVSDQNK